MFSVATAMLCKEQGITVTGVCAIYEVFVAQKVSVHIFFIPHTAHVYTTFCLTSYIWVKSRSSYNVFAYFPRNYCRHIPTYYELKYYTTQHSASENILTSL